jgi:hypothetical protein
MRSAHQGVMHKVHPTEMDAANTGDPYGPDQVRHDTAGTCYKYDWRLLRRPARAGLPRNDDLFLLW